MSQPGTSSGQEQRQKASRKQRSAVPIMAADPNMTVDLTQEDDAPSSPIFLEDDECIVVEHKMGSNSSITLYVNGNAEHETHARTARPSPSKKRKLGHHRQPQPPPPPPVEPTKPLKCPICLDSLIDKEKQLVSTKCGHIFCKTCLTDSLKHVKQCPTCRAKLTAKTGFHPIFL